MDKSQVTDILEEIAVLLELKGENPFKARAYTNAARVLDQYDGDLAQLVAEDRLEELPGIGDALQQKITELVKTGKLEYYETLRASVPEGLLAMMDIPALGPKKIKALHEKLGIASVAELEAACQAHKVRDLAGFGAKTEEKILAGIAQARDYAHLFRYAEAWAEAEEIREALRDHEAVIQLSVAGSLRRGKEIVKDLDFVASSRQPQEVMDYFVALPWVKTVTNHGTTKSSVLLESGISADLRVVSDKEFPYALHHFTGSKEHNVAMRQRAIAQGKKLSEWGLFEIGAGKKIPRTTTANSFPAAPRTNSSPRSAFNSSRPNCARTSAKSRPPRQKRSHASSTGCSCAARSTATPTGAMARTRSPKWPKQRANSASTISASPITRSHRIRRMASTRSGWRSRSG